MFMKDSWQTLNRIIAAKHTFMNMYILFVEYKNRIPNW